MLIRRADKSEYETVRAFYHSMIDAMEGTRYHPKWQKDIYPSPDDLRTALDEDTLYIGFSGDRIAAAMAVNQKCNEEYKDAAWSRPLTQDEFAVIHMLGVHGDFARKGYAREMVRYAVSLARDAGMKAVRLDVLKGNVPAERLYKDMGFRYVDTLQLFYEDTGRVDFDLYELDIDQPVINSSKTESEKK